MDPYQRELIRKNEKKLLEETRCTEVFLTIFSSKGILYQEDLENIQAQGKNYGNIRKAKEFYSIIITRTNGYNVLLEALRATKQTGVLTILNQESSSSEPTPKARKIMKFIGSPQYMEEFNKLSTNVMVISSKDCKITCERIIDCTPHATNFKLDDFVDFVSTQEGRSSTSNLTVVNCEDDIDTGISSVRLVTTNIVLVTSIDFEDLKKRFTKTKKAHVKPHLVEDSFTWDDLSPAYKKQLTSAINSQVKIEQNIRWFDADSIDTESIIDIINGNNLQLLKDTLPEELKYYIPRRLINRRMVSFEIFKKGGQDVYLFEDIARYKLTELADGQGTEKSSTLVNSQSIFNYQFVILEQAHHFEQIVKKYNSRPVHVLIYAENHFVWKKSSGSIHNIQTSLIAEQPMQEEEDFIRDIVLRNSNDRYPVCISDTPGMGKSVLLAHFARLLMQKATDKIVCFVVISELVKIVREDKKLILVSKETVLSALVKYFGRNKLGETYLRKHPNKIQELLFDGFDELNSEDISFAYDILQTIQSEFKETRIWVTTRPHMFLELEKNLGVLGSNIQAFAEKDQVNFLKSFWARNNDFEASNENKNCKLEDFAKSCLQSLKSAINNREEDIAGIPLQCMLIGEVFEDEARQHHDSEDPDVPQSISSNVSITSMLNLYESLISHKIQKFHKFYGAEELDHSNVIKIHEFLSICLIFPRCRQSFKGQLCPTNFSTAVQQVFNVGILESRSILPVPRFIHRTFAEYFVAKFIVDTLKDSPNTTVLNFVHSHVLKTPPQTFKVRKINFKTRDFKHNVICYFINALLQQCKIIGNVKSPRTDKLLIQMTEACVFNDFKELYRNFLHKFAIKDEFRLKIFTERFIKLVVLRGNSSMLQITFDILTSSNNVRIIDIQEEEHTLLHLAVMRGNYKLFETLISKDSFKELLVKDDKRFHNIVHECVQDSKHNSIQTIHDKLEIVKYLVGMNQNLISYRNKTGELPIECKRINVNLVIELIKSGQLISMEMNELCTVVHNMTSVLSSDDYVKFLQVVLADRDKNFKERVVNSKHKRSYLLERLFRVMEPETVLLEFLKENRANFDILGDVHAICLPIKYKRGTTCIKWLLDNIEWNAVDIQKAFLMKYDHFYFIKTLINGKYIDNLKEIHWFHLVCKLPTLSREHLELAQYLKFNSFEVNVKDDNSETALDILIQGECNQYSLGVFNLLQADSNISTNLEFIKISWLIKKSYPGNLNQLRHTFFTHVKENWNKDADGNTLLHLAATTRDIEKIELAFHWHPDINATNNKQQTPLHLLTQSNYFCMDCWKWLVEKKASIWGRDLDNNTPVSNLLLHFPNFITAMSYVIDHIDNDELIVNFEGTNFCDTYGNTLLHFAAQHRSLQLLNILLKASYNINAINKDKQTPLHCVYHMYNSSFSLECWKVLVDYGADVFALDNSKRTPICWLKYVRSQDISLAVIHVLAKFPQDISSTERVMWLVIKNLDLNVVKCACDWYKTKFQLPLEKVTTTINDTCSTLLDVALESANGDVLEYVLQDLKCSTLLANSPTQSVFMCMRNGYVNIEKRLKIIKVLTEQYSSLDILNSVNENGLVPLSVKECDESFVQKFVELGANVNARDANDNTPLHWSLKLNTYYPPIKLIEQLIKCGADVNAINKQHEFPLLLTLRLHYLEIAKLICLLINNNADPCKTDSSGNNILHLLPAIPFFPKKDFSDVLKCIVDKEYYDLFKSRNDAGYTPLEIAKQHGFTFSNEIIQILRQNNIDV